MISPAGSSAALLMRKPDDNRAIDDDPTLLVLSRLRNAFSAVTLMLIRRLMEKRLLRETARVSAMVDYPKRDIRHPAGTMLSQPLETLSSLSRDDRLEQTQPIPFS